MSTIVLSGDTSGSITLQPTSSGSGTLTLPSSSGSLLTRTIPAGTATTAPLTFSNGTTTTTPITGAWEYDGEVFYNTPAGAQRGVTPTQITYYLNATRTGLNNTSSQSIFGVGVSLSSNTVYDIEAWVTMLASGSTVASILNLGFGGTATVNGIIYQTQSVFDAGVTNTQVDTTENMAIVNTIAQTPITVSAACGAATAIIRGTVSIANGGTFIPQYSWNVNPGSAWVVQAGSYFTVYPVGAAGANVSVGTWS